MSMTKATSRFKRYLYARMCACRVASRREKGQPRKEKPSTLKDLQDDVVLSGLDKKICGDWPMRLFWELFSRDDAKCL